MVVVELRVESGVNEIISSECSRREFIAVEHFLSSNKSVEME